MTFDGKAGHVTVCVWVQESLKATVDGQQLNLDTQDLGTGSKTLGKAAARYVCTRARCTNNGQQT